MTGREISRAYALRLLKERHAFDAGSPDWDYRTRTAYKIIQLARGVPLCAIRDWQPKHTEKRAAE